MNLTDRYQEIQYKSVAQQDHGGQQKILQGGFDHGVVALKDKFPVDGVVDRGTDQPRANIGEQQVGGGEQQ